MWRIWTGITFSYPHNSISNSTFIVTPKFGGVWKNSKYNFNTTSKCHSIHSQLAVVILDWILCAVFTSHNKTVTRCRHQTFYSLCENGAFSVTEQMLPLLQSSMSYHRTYRVFFTEQMLPPLQRIMIYCRTYRVFFTEQMLPPLQSSMIYCRTYRVFFTEQMLPPLQSSMIYHRTYGVFFTEQMLQPLQSSMMHCRSYRH